MSLQWVNADAGAAERPTRVAKEDVLKAVSRGTPDWGGTGADILQINEGFASIRRPIRASELNLNGTVSGPTLFWMCDAVCFVATLATRGPGAETASTVSMTMNFLRAASPSAIQADCRILRSGNRLIVAEIRVFPEGRGDEIIANATGIFSAAAQRAT